MAEDKKTFGSGDQHAARPPEELSPENLAKEMNYGDRTRGADAEHIGNQGPIDTERDIPDRDNEALVIEDEEFAPADLHRQNRRNKAA